MKNANIIINVGGALNNVYYRMFFYSRRSKKEVLYYEIESIEEIGSICDEIVDFTNMESFQVEKCFANIFIKRTVSSDAGFKQTKLFHNILIHYLLKKRIDKLESVRVFYIDTYNMAFDERDLFHQCLAEMEKAGFEESSSTDVPSRGSLNRLFGISDFEKHLDSFLGALNPAVLANFYKEVLEKVIEVKRSDPKIEFFSNLSHYIVGFEEFEYISSIEQEIADHDVQALIELSLKIVNYSLSVVTVPIIPHEDAKAYNKSHPDDQTIQQEIRDYTERLKRKKKQFDDDKLLTNSKKDYKTFAPKTLSGAAGFNSEVDPFVQHISKIAKKFMKTKNEQQWNEYYQEVSTQIHLMDEKIADFARQESLEFSKEPNSDPAEVRMNQIDEKIEVLMTKIKGSFIKYAVKRKECISNNIDLNDELAARYHLDNTNQYIRYLFACRKKCKLTGFLLVSIFTLLFAVIIPYIRTQPYVMNEGSGFVFFISYVILLAVLFAIAFPAVLLSYKRMIKKTLTDLQVFLLAYFENYKQRAASFEQTLNNAYEVERLCDEYNRLADIKNEFNRLCRQWFWHKKKIEEHIIAIDYFSDFIKETEQTKRDDIPIIYNKSHINNKFYWLDI